MRHNPAAEHFLLPFSMYRYRTMVMATLFLVLESTAHALPTRSIGWWWTAPATASDPAVDAMLTFVKENTGIVSTLIMECGIVTCVHNKSHGADRTQCINNGGAGGKITGELSPACLRALPTLNALGIRAELWLGEDDSILSAHTLFNTPIATATALINVSARYPGIVGFNIVCLFPCIVPSITTGTPSTSFR